VFLFGEEVELEMPLAGIRFVGQQPFPGSLVACTVRVDFAQLSSLYRDIQHDRIASLKACLDKASAIGLHNRDCRPQSSLIDERHPPEPTNMGQFYQAIEAISRAWMGDE
jgi:hypothetical protein